ncbi:prenylcysteine oxidase [Xylariaceae sp. FL0594]|nr:prenylcysteine oxidase [Xylariaceae sp. FL0594]
MLFQNLLSFLSFTASVPQAEIAPSDDGGKQVAIIGAGAAGASAAYHLRKYANATGLGQKLNITVFERASRVGGRTLTVNVYDDPSEAIEVGASIFVDVNQILCNATRDFGLTVKEPGGGDGDGGDDDGNGGAGNVLGIWDGDAFVYTQDSRSWDWVNLVKLFWKYGTAPYYTRRLVRDTVATFLKLYEEPFFPFRSLSDRAYELGLVKITGVTGKQFLEANKLDGAFAHHIVQASTRVNYASNLEHIHGLGTMVSMAPEGTKAIEGGNWQIFSEMIKASGAALRLDTAVTGIALLSGSDRKYKITTASTSSPDSGSTTPESQDNTKGKRPKSQLPSSSNQQHPILFDDIVIAAPFQYANISALLPDPIDAIPYATLHVTLFASPFKFSPVFFNLAPGSSVPDSVLTTLGKDEVPQSGAAGAGKAGFYSATLQRVVINPRTRNPEYVYKIFSPEAVTSEFLSGLLGVEVSDSSLVWPRSESETSSPFFSGVQPISWYHATTFHPYPQKLPRVTFQDPVLREGLYYTSGIESFISTMETSALMGMNVARLIVDSYADLVPPASDDGNSNNNNDTATDTQTTAESSSSSTITPEVIEEQHIVVVEQDVVGAAVDEAGEL